MLRAPVLAACKQGEHVLAAMTNGDVHLYTSLFTISAFVVMGTFYSRTLINIDSLLMTVICYELIIFNHMVNKGNIHVHTSATPPLPLMPHPSHTPVSLSPYFNVVYLSISKQ